MRPARLRHRPLRNAVYSGATLAVVGLLMLTALHDERYSLDQQCSKYASAKACRVF
jgi:hypothetical protein